MTLTRLRQCTVKLPALITEVSITTTINQHIYNIIRVLLVSGIPSEWYNKLSVRPLLDAFMNELEVLSNNSAYKVSDIAS